MASLSPRAFGIMAVLFALVNANHAGVPFLSNRPKVPCIGRNVGIVLAPFWAATAAVIYLGLRCP